MRADLSRPSDVSAVLSATDPAVVLHLAACSW